MARSPRHIGAGNVNLKGKKSKLMRCGCCRCLDLRKKNLDAVLKKDLEEDIAEITQR